MIPIRIAIGRIKVVIDVVEELEVDGGHRRRCWCCPRSTPFADRLVVIGGGGSGRHDGGDR